MIYKKFEKNDIFYNTLKTRPNYEFILGKDKQLYIGSQNKLYDANLGDKYILKTKKNSDGSIFNDSLIQSFYGQAEDEISKKLPLEVTVSCSFFEENSTYSDFVRASKRLHIHALKNTLNKKIVNSSHYAFSSSYGDKSLQSINLISIPSLFYGSNIEKGTLELSFYITGTLISTLQDIKLNGELIQTFGEQNLGKVAGVALYNEGVILLTGSWSLNDTAKDIYRYNEDNTVEDEESPKWIYWGAGLNQQNNQTEKSYFSLKFNGINYVNTLTMFANAEKGDLNHSNNLTYIKYGEMKKYLNNVTSNSFSQPEFMEIKNTVKYDYEIISGSLEKQTFISKIGIYDENKNLIAIAKMAKPVKKKENRNYTFKLKLDI